MNTTPTETTMPPHVRPPPLHLSRLLKCFNGLDRSSMTGLSYLDHVEDHIKAFLGVSTSHSLTALRSPPSIDEYSIIHTHPGLTMHIPSGTLPDAAYILFVPYAQKDHDGYTEKAPTPSSHPRPRTFATSTLAAQSRYAYSIVFLFCEVRTRFQRMGYSVKSIHEESPADVTPTNPFLLLSTLV